MMNFMQTVTKKLKDTRGATMVEYALIVALIAVASISALTSFSGKVNSKFETVGNTISTAGTGGATP